VKIKKEFDPEEAHLSVKHERFCDSTKDVRIAIVRPRTDGERYRPEHFCTVVFDKKSERISVVADPKRLDQPEYVTETQDFQTRVKDEFNRQRREEVISAEQFRQVFNRATRKCAAIPLRGTQIQFGDKKNGGIYYVDAIFSDQLGQLRQLFVNAGNGTNLGIMPVHNDPESLSIIQSSCKFEFQSQIVDFVEGIDEELATGDMTPRMLKTRRKKAAELLRMISTHRDNLAEKASEFADTVGKIEGLIGTRLTYASGKVVKPFSLADELGWIDEAIETGVAVETAPEVDTGITEADLVAPEEIFNESKAGSEEPETKAEGDIWSDLDSDDDDSAS
jgi:hypothetical protein